jgi:hypothetical protein
LFERNRAPVPWAGAVVLGSFGTELIFTVKSAACASPDDPQQLADAGARTRSVACIGRGAARSVDRKSSATRIVFSHGMRKNPFAGKHMQGLNARAMPEGRSISSNVLVGTCP